MLEPGSEIYVYGVPSMLCEVVEVCLYREWGFCYAKQFENLLVEAYIFTILSISFL